jgi:hypothetical protein
LQVSPPMRESWKIDSISSLSSQPGEEASFKMVFTQARRRRPPAGTRTFRHTCSTRKNRCSCMIPVTPHKTGTKRPKLSVSCDRQRLIAHRKDFTKRYSRRCAAHAVSIDCYTSLELRARMRYKRTYSSKVLVVQSLAIAASPLRAAFTKSVIIRSMTDQSHRLFCSEYPALIRIQNVGLFKTAAQLHVGVKPQSLTTVPNVCEVVLF